MLQQAWWLQGPSAVLAPRVPTAPSVRTVQLDAALVISSQMEARGRCHGRQQGAKCRRTENSMTVMPAIRRARSIVGPGMATCKAARCTINRKTNRTCGDTGVVNMTTAKFNSGGIGIGNNSDTTTSAVTSVDDCRCEEGYEGFLCSRCSDGWTREAWDTTGSGTCSRCPADASLNRLSLAAGALVLILGIIIFIYQTIKDKGEEDFVGVVMCKILFSHLQII